MEQTNFHQTGPMIAFYNGPFSQWYTSGFTFDFGDKIIPFMNAEQWMMWNKAMCFKDDFVATQILKSKNPKEQKAFGRAVTNFKPDIWNVESWNVVFVGNLAKFTQSQYCGAALLTTEDKYIAEGSPFDRIWGTGLSVEDTLKRQIGDWPGENRLGKVLMAVRRFMRENPGIEINSATDLPNYSDYRI